MNNNYFRPKAFAEYIGQKNIINSLNIYIQASLRRGESLDHILFYGAPGCGKTSLAFLIGIELASKVIFLNGPNLKKTSDLISVLANLKEKEIVFIDEIHAVEQDVLETLYPAIDDNRISLVIGKEYNSKVINIKIPNFTLIAATTELHKIPHPLMSRFSISYSFDEYSVDDIQKIVELTANKLGLELKQEWITAISLNCKTNPRIAINLLKRINDYFMILNEREKDIQNIMNKIGIFNLGLTRDDIKYLKTLVDFTSLGLESLSQILNIPKNTILNNIEPFLLKENFIIRTSKGRKLTNKGINYINSLYN
ncbi:Holliday junction branch migration DNA helicase RuvB [Spiroplasma endosymbiont of Crioceris asparagi]|uniref:Holliday junction branch migration DNA helicase RuvB n=1 Tax=Spiroplasma endosymbiont of Crioceris asparagi TaxID=3066286 RepID=UPI0030CD1832